MPPDALETWDILRPSMSLPDTSDPNYWAGLDDSAPVPPGGGSGGGGRTPRRGGGGDGGRKDEGRTITEDGVALAFAGEQQDRLAFDHTQQRWYVWQGDRWLLDETGLAFDLARDMVRGVRMIDPEQPKSLAKIGFTRAVETAARSDRRCAVHVAMWDQDPWLLSVPGGYINLRTGEMLSGRPGLYMSKQTAVAPAASGTPAPEWERFLDQATGGDKEMQAFLQRLCGYCLTGDVTEEILTFIYGPGGNGKGVLIGTLTGILGDYAVSMPMEAFTANSRVNPEYYRAQMYGARLVTASETESGATWAESQIKELTGNEAPVSARHPHGRPFTYQPGFKLAIVGNHAPKLKSRSPAMERRLRILPFVHKPENPDHTLKERLREEWPAILRWMIDGCLDWQDMRLGTCKAIQEATSSYFEQQDSFGRWIEDKCILDSTLSVKTGVLFSNFKSWMVANGEDAPNLNDFAELIDRKDGLRRVFLKGQRIVRGIGLQASTSVQTEARYGD